MEKQELRRLRAYLDLTIRSLHGHDCIADIRFYPPGNDIASDLVTNVPVTLNLQELRAVAHDPNSYSDQLTTSVFKDERIRNAWERILGYIQGANATLHMRLCLDDTAEALHQIHWELLSDTPRSTSFCRRERFLFSRYLGTQDLTNIWRPARKDMRALIVIASPRDLQEYQLASIDVPGELKRTEAALHDIPSTVLASGLPDNPATLVHLCAELRKGYSILYLVCHGTMEHGKPYLWLEHQDGTCHHVEGTELVQRIADLEDRRPFLAVLASCQSASTDRKHGLLEALGPQIARSGVPAVVGMQGDIPVPTVETFMPKFFQALRESGNVDYALAVSRSDLTNDHPWWIPVLFTRVRDGRIWSDQPDADQFSSSVRDALLAFQDEFRLKSNQIQTLRVYKSLHDQLHDLQFECFNCLQNDIMQAFPDPQSLDHLEAQIFILQRINESLHDTVNQSQVEGIHRERTWIVHLKRALNDLDRTLDTRDSGLLNQSIRLIERILEIEPIRINQRLKDAADSLELPRLIEVISLFRYQISQHRDASHIQRILDEGIAALSILHQSLESLVREHDHWQDLDRELHLIQVYLDLADVSEFTHSWYELSVRVTKLCEGSNERWAQRFTSETQRVTQAISIGQLEQIKAGFLGYRRQASLRLFRVDKQLVEVCHQIQPGIVTPLNEALRMMV